MKERLIITIIAVNMLLTGCGNNKIIDDQYFNKAIIKKADGKVITVAVDYYTCETGSIVITTKDGHKYGVAYTDVTMINE